MKKSNIVCVLLMAVFAMLLTACEQRIVPASSDAAQRQAQETLSQQGNAVAGMPAITKFSEKKLMKEILEARDKDIPTITYIVDMNGKFHKVCNSIGYGLPYATQYTNPQKIAASAHQYGYAVLPQADPNGLFSPQSADGTWVQCVAPDGKKFAPLFIEPRVIVSPFPLI